MSLKLSDTRRTSQTERTEPDRARKPDRARSRTELKRAALHFHFPRPPLPPASRVGSNRFCAVPLFCTGARRNLATCGTKQEARKRRFATLTLVLVPRLSLAGVCDHAALQPHRGGALLRTMGLLLVHRFSLVRPARSFSLFSIVKTIILDLGSPQTN